MAAKRGEGENKSTILTLGTEESMWTEANIWLGTGTTVETNRIAHCCRKRVRKSRKHDIQIKPIKHVLLLQRQE